MMSYPEGFFEGEEISMEDVEDAIHSLIDPCLFETLKRRVEHWESVIEEEAAGLGLTVMTE